MATLQGDIRDLPVAAHADYAEWVDDVTGVLDDRADALLVYDGLDPEPDVAGWVASSRLGTVLCVGLAVLFGVLAVRVIVGAIWGV